MWVYVQRTGSLYRASGERLAVGYAGHGVDKNRPESQALVERGPLPCGVYQIAAPIARTAGGLQYALPLFPDHKSEMFGRGSFLIHGDRIGGPAGNASNGCIVLARSVRALIWASGDRLLKVVAEEPAKEGAL